MSVQSEVTVDAVEIQRKGTFSELGSTHDRCSLHRFQKLHSLVINGVKRWRKFSSVDMKRLADHVRILEIMQSKLREGNGTPLQYSCLENPMDGGAWQAAVHGVAESRTRLSDFTFTFLFLALEKEMATHSSVLAWRIPGMGNLLGCRLWGYTESDTTEATQQKQQQQTWRRAWQPTPVFLPGESPWTEEPGRLQLMGSQRVGHN